MAGPLLLAAALVVLVVGLTCLSRRHPPAGAPARARQREEPVTLPGTRVEKWPGPAPEPQPRETVPFDSIVAIGPTEHAHVTVPRREGK
jgi:hypothetical protein